jgi:hypothetical protein
MSFNIACPECKTTLKSSKPIAAGKIITCPKCSVMFPAPAVKPKPVAVPAGVDVVEDDDEFGDVEIIEDPPKKKEAPKPTPKAPGDDRPKSKRRKKSNAGLIIGLCAGLIGLAAFATSAFFAVRWLLKENNDPVAYLPPKPAIMMSIDVGKLADSPLGPIIEPLVGGGEYGKYCQDMGSTVKAQLDRFVFGMGQVRPGNQPPVSVVYVSKSGFDRQKLSQAFGATAQTFGGRSVYQTGSGAAARSIVFSSKVAAVIGGPVSDAEDVVRTAGRNSPPTIFEDMLKRVSGGHFWMITDASAFTAENPIMKAVPGNLRDAMSITRCMGTEMSLAGDYIESKTYYLMPSPASADTLAAEMKKYADASPVSLPGLQPSEPPTTTSSESIVTVAGRFKTADLVTGLGVLSKMASMFAPTPPAGGRGGGRR